MEAHYTEGKLKTVTLLRYGSLDGTGMMACRGQRIKSGDQLDSAGDQPGPWPSGLAQGYSWLCEGVEPASSFGAVVSRFWGEGQPGPHSRSSSSRAQAGGLLCTTGSRRTGIGLSTQWVPFWNILQPWLQGRLPTDTGLGTIPGSPGT